MYAAEASFSRCRIASQPHGKGSLANFEGDGLLGHRRSATGQEADQTPQDEHHAKGNSISGVVCHVGGSLLTRVSRSWVLSREDRLHCL